MSRRQFLCLYPEFAYNSVRLQCTMNWIGQNTKFCHLMESKAACCWPGDMVMVMSKTPILTWLWFKVYFNKKYLLSIGYVSIWLHIFLKKVFCIRVYSAAWHSSSLAWLRDHTFLEITLLLRYFRCWHFWIKSS